MEPVPAPGVLHSLTVPLCAALIHTLFLPSFSSLLQGLQGFCAGLPASPFSPSAPHPFFSRPIPVCLILFHLYFSWKPSPRPSGPHPHPHPHHVNHLQGSTMCSPLWPQKHLVRPTRNPTNLAKSSNPSPKSFTPSQHHQSHTSAAQGDHPWLHLPLHIHQAPNPVSLETLLSIIITTPRHNLN